MNKMLPDKLSNISVRLPLYGYLYHLGAHVCKLSLVLHVSANASLLVPDEEVLLELSCLSNEYIKFL